MAINPGCLACCQFIEGNSPGLRSTVEQFVVGAGDEQLGRRTRAHQK